MSIFKRSPTDVQQPGAAPAVETITERQPAQAATVTPPFPQTTTLPGVVPPPAAPIYSTLPPEPTPSAQGTAESLVAEKVRIAKEAQQTAQERVRLAVRRSKTTAAPPPGARTQATQLPSTTRRAAPGQPADPCAYAQTGLLNLAWRWQEAGAPIRAIHTYMELLRRYPDTAAAAVAIADLVTLSERLADQGQFHTALGIYDELEELQ